jgi:ribonucleoside-triphosphate reductase
MGYFNSIKKRNGSVVPFDKEKIVQAIFKAAQSVGGSDIEVARKLAEKVVFVSRIKFDSETDVPSVEQMQDIVEKVLVEEGHAKTAKAYILYREQQSRIREMKDTFVDVEETIDEYISQGDWRVKENSNEAYSFSGLLLHTAGKVIASYALTKIYPKEVSEAYRKGYIHIHDLSHGFIGYCAGWSLKDLLVKGFGGVANKVDAKPAKHLDVVVHQMVNFIGCLQMEFAGAQAFSVHPKETIIIKDSMGNVDVVRIEEFFNKFNNPVSSFDGIEFKDVSNEDYYTLSFTENGNSSWKKVKKVIRHDITDPLHMVRTNKGIVSVSKSHSVFSLNSHHYLGKKENALLEYIKSIEKLFSYDLSSVGKKLGIEAPEKIIQKFKNQGLIANKTLNYEDNPQKHYAVYRPLNDKRLVLKKTSELSKLSKEVKTKDQKNDNLAALSKIELPEKGSVNILEIANNNPKLKDSIWIKLTEEQSFKLKEKIQSKTSLRKLSAELGYSKAYVWNLLNRNLIPLKIYEEFGDFNNVLLTRFRDKNAIEPLLQGEKLELFVKLIAWYITEGWKVHKQSIGISQKGKYCNEIIQIANSLRVRHFIQDYDSGKKQIILGGIIPAFITQLCGQYSYNKKIPSFIFNLNNNLKELFIRELIKGDGYKRNDGTAIVSTSNKLITGLNLIGISLGYRTSIKTRFIENFGKKKKQGEKLTRYDLIFHNKKSPLVVRYNDFESSVIFDNSEFESECQYEYDLSVEDTETFIGGVGLFGLHNSSVDTLLAPFVRADNLTYRQTKQCLQELVYSLNIPSRWGCFSEDTEILTEHGWKLGKDLDEGEVIATFNMEKEEIEYKPVLKMTKDHFKGKMFNLKNRVTDQLVTPNHKVLRRIHNFEEGKSASKYVLEEAQKLKTKIPLIPLGAKFKGEEIDKNLVKSLAWITSEGSLCRNERIVIYQSQEMNPENCDEIRDTLDELEIPFDEMPRQSGFTGKMNCVRFRLNRPESRRIHEEFFPDYVKRIPESLRNVSTEHAREFIDTYMKGDGHVPENKIYTKKKEDADFLQELIVKSGWGSTLLKNKNGIYVVRVIKHDFTQITSINEVDYDGIVWCPTTTNNTVVVRRNGKVFLSGNSQYPFSNLTFDWTVPEDMENDKAIVGGKETDYTYGDLQKEMDMINKAFLEVMQEGDANGRIFTFPIPTYNLTKDFNWDSENAKLLFEVTAKYGTPYFQNYVGSDLDPKSIRAMCCRLAMDTNQLINRPGGMWGPGDATGSIGVITINVNRIAFESKTKDEFFEKLSYLMNLAKTSLEIKRKIINKNLKNGLMPFTKVYLGSFNNHFSTIGLCGMNEACVNFLGKDISSEQGKKFAIETLTFMREKCFEFQKESGNLYNLEATPAESASFRLAMLDKKFHPEIYTAGKDTPYLTNSTQLPVNFTEDAITAILHQNEIQPLYTGGTIFHTFLGEKMSSGESCKQLVKKIAENTKLPYYSITPTFSVCPVHGYIAGEHFQCPLEVKEKIKEVILK